MKHFLAMCLTVVFSATNATAFDFSSYSSDFNASDYREALKCGICGSRTAGLLYLHVSGQKAQDLQAS